jgi:hypothetical protein
MVRGDYTVLINALISTSIKLQPPSNKNFELLSLLLVLVYDFFFQLRYNFTPFFIILSNTNTFVMNKLTKKSVGL